MVYDDKACASSEREGRGDEVATMVSDIDKSHSVGSISFESYEKSDIVVEGVSAPSQYPSSSAVDDESEGEAMSTGGGDGERISMSLNACDCSCAVRVVMEGCRGVDRYVSNLESRRADGPCEEWGVEQRDVNGEISAEVHCSMLNSSAVGFGDDPKVKFSLNISPGYGVAVERMVWLKSSRSEKLWIIARESVKVRHCPVSPLGDF
jgi:hypothetical protein